MLTRLFTRYIGFAERHTARLLVIYALIAAGALYTATRLELHTDFAELLPDQHPAVVAFRRVISRQTAASNLVMIIHGPSTEATHQMAEKLRPELDKLVAEHTFTSIDWKPDSEAPAFIARNKFLYAPKADIQRAEDLLERVIAKRSSPLAIDIDDDADEELRKLRDTMTKQLPSQPAPEVRYFENDADGEHWLGVMMWRKRDGLATKGDYETMDQVRAVVAAAHPEKIDPKMKVEFTGHIASALDEQSGIKDDLTAATGVCLCGVLLVVLLYFRRWAVLGVVTAPAAFGLFLALSLATVTVKYLNLNTTFLVSIILGNGINSPIIVMARFGEERREGRSVADALLGAMRGTFTGTLTAMVAAAIAYGSLLATTFRGFSQFGLIGGSGMLLVWLATFLLIPPMVILGERLRPGLLTPLASWVKPIFGAFGGMIARAPLMFTLLVVGGTALLWKPVQQYLKDPLEWNFGNLRTESKATPSQRLWSRMEKLGMGNVGAGRVGNDGVFLVDEPSEAAAVAAAVRKKDADDPTLRMIKEVRTLDSLLPSEQQEKLEILGRIRHQIDRHERLMDTDEQKLLADWRPPDTLRVLMPEDLPKLWLDAFTEVDGHRGRFIGIDADNARYYSNNGHDLERLARVLQVDALGKTWVAASAGTIFGSMVEAIRTDGKTVTLVALTGVMLLVLVMFGPKGALPVLGSLALGLFWLVGALGLWDRMGEHAWRGAYSKLNFMNFVAVPITLGVGADYAANIWARLRGDKKVSVADAIGDTGSAVALCSLTTIIGYSTLLLSRNHALRSFGLVADLGELTCLFAALVTMPILGRAILRRRAR
jgi:predicted RND superfamily exporter protein